MREVDAVWRAWGAADHPSSSTYSWAVGFWNALERAGTGTTDDDAIREDVLDRAAHKPYVKEDALVRILKVLVATYAILAGRPSSARIE